MTDPVLGCEEPGGSAKKLVFSLNVLVLTLQNFLAEGLRAERLRGVRWVRPAVNRQGSFSAQLSGSHTDDHLLLLTYDR